jgi:hypothetical protein
MNQTIELIAESKDPDRLKIFMEELIENMKAITEIGKIKVKITLK